MDINATKTQIMINSEGNFTSEININNDKLNIVEKCKYVGAIIAIKSKILARTGKVL